MNEATCLVDTREALLDLGFKPDPKVYSEQVVGLSYNFDSFQVKVGRMTNLRMSEVLSFSGVVRTTRSLASIEFEMPLQIESVAQCAAWVTWHLKKYLERHDGHSPGQQPQLVSLGLQHQATLPWLRRQAEYAARPHCIVKREWLRLALKELKTVLIGADDTEEVQFHFDGVVLHLLYRQQRIACPATGTEWSNRYAITAKCLLHLPKRLMCETPSISVWDGKLHIDRTLYLGVRELPSQPA